MSLMTQLSQLSQLSCDTSATLATLECLKPDCSCTDSESSDCVFLDVAAWVTSCQPAQTLIIPPEHIDQITELQTLANERIRWRHPTLRVWREGEDELCCKVFFGPESRSLPAKTAAPRAGFKVGDVVLRRCGAKNIRAGAAGAPNRRIMLSIKN